MSTYAAGPPGVAEATPADAPAAGAVEPVADPSAGPVTTLATIPTIRTAARRATSQKPRSRVRTVSS
jgi:hypothetical protein